MVENRKEAESSLKHLGILVTGLRSGETIKGTRTIALGTILNYRMPIDGINPDLYIIPPRKKDLDFLREFPDLWENFLIKLASIPFFRELTILKREEWLKSFESEKDVDISERGGEIEIIQLGNSDLAIKLSEDQISYIIEKGWMKASELREMIPGKPGTNAKRHTLFFLRCFWSLYNLNKTTENTLKNKTLTFDLDNGNVYDSGMITKTEEMIYLFQSSTNQEFGIKVTTSVNKILK